MKFNWLTGKSQHITRSFFWSITFDLQLWMITMIWFECNKLKVKIIFEQNRKYKKRYISSESLFSFLKQYFLKCNRCKIIHDGWKYYVKKLESDDVLLTEQSLMFNLTSLFTRNSDKILYFFSYWLNVYFVHLIQLFALQLQYNR